MTKPDVPWLVLTRSIYGYPVAYAFDHKDAAEREAARLRAANLPTVLLPFDAVPGWTEADAARKESADDDA